MAEFYDYKVSAPIEPGEYIVALSGPGKVVRTLWFDTNYWSDPEFDTGGENWNEKVLFWQSFPEHPNK